ncbi:unnamed protein product [Penicillium salamii]|uniref:SWIRM domain-containing protein n=1 Tax=Penicillium salamii TaxID=1612424 RepID=A0A9W4J9U6_9EURO|nr:unnamed protein product [Penicillium salamii]CAG8368138.1 unnamed protein product [Penicillium salamii]CAG8378230.1 unnamed protein product [Penicillium salamii]
MTSPGQSAQQPNMNRLSVSSLMSPPETKPIESFPALSPFAKPHPTSGDMKLPPIATDRKRTQSEMNLPSPPVTPYTGNKKRDSPSDHLEVGSSRDPVLFPPQDSSTDAHEEPLFGPAPPSTDALVARHIDSHMALFRNKVNKPTRDEYLLALSCVPIVSTQYNRNPAAWAREERETLERQMVMMNRHRPDREPKLKRIAPAPAKKAGVQPRMQQRPRVRRTPKSTPKQQVFDTFDSPPATKPRTLGTNRDDTDYHSLMDYSPPLETLGSNVKALKADWKGQMLDLSGDVDKHMLSPAELNLASTLRLSCATYLCSKRRIFEARVRALGVGKEFRKTDAQQACKIDVNKASKLWTAYERVGWFKPEYFHQYLK